MNVEHRVVNLTRACLLDIVQPNFHETFVPNVLYRSLEISKYFDMFSICKVRNTKDMSDIPMSEKIT